MIKILLGGSPCTFWSVAQKNNRETTAEGQGWELFKNYLIAKEMFKPDIFLYENNKSAAQAIKDQIKKELSVDGVNNHYIEINSALVSAQNRKRFYVHNCGLVEQPKDRNIVLKDIITTPCDNPVIYQRPHGFNDGGIKANKAPTLTANAAYTQNNLIVHPIKVGEVGNGGQGNRIYSVDGKSVTQTAQSGGLGSYTGLYAIPVMTTRQSEEKVGCLRATYYKCGNSRNLTRNLIDGRGYEGIVEPAQEKSYPVYEVKDGYICIKNKEYPIKLPDGLYTIRKLSPVECERLQTMPDNYTEGVSDTQRYKMLGNGWTAEVILHILGNALAGIPKDEQIFVISLYDGIATGRYVLDKLGFTNIKYYAYEIDKYAIQIAQKNYPDIIQRGDAFAVRGAWTSI